ncbi:protein-glutamine gamma-glutamyltransferase K [Acipenser ruthenus]|uniref:protein-glutamine gamma-glutamyltransferase K n=1 Tax=Acipenser ruthenus TaxID=7906 RepID=UPI0015603CC9|nr:protein-glutamine gamma-glutamyltransferase K [Acipenser ruthenus]XP_033853104.2 protein-glutamine gamma-glutamyltransferase K [Acipenser ruthenus]
MPANSVSVRRRSELGRWPTVSLGGIGEEDEVTPGTAGDSQVGTKRQESRCSAWMRRVCPCVCKKSADDVTDNSGPTATMEDDKRSVPLSDLILSVKSVDLMKSRSGINRKEHHTDEFEYDDLILRRGQSFVMEIEFSRPFNPDTDTMHLELQIGPLPQVSKGTHVIIPLVEELEDNRWEAKIVQRVGTKMKLSVGSPVTAVIGRYKFAVATHSSGGDFKMEHNPKNDITFLFNPWCENDTVFMDDEKFLKEYVLNETGKIYYGTEKQIGARTWNFGQFDAGVLEACLFILDRSGVPHAGRGDPVNVVRVISALVNSMDEDGVLVGNWSGDYSLGTAPTAWSGSVDILTQYHRKGGKPVSYGQCWVFSGVTTTVLRCLGIPTRSVTNFCSAHDTDVSLTTDIYLDENMEPLAHLNMDSIWNFHVWNDCWLARPDLPPGMGGWQAVDATPQETSQGTFCCGPSSVIAIRNGLVYYSHDTPFIFAEVNSDKIYWQRQADGSFTKVFSENKAVGRCISTKAVGSEEREDITDLYKHPEGSEEERIAVETACRYGSKPDVYSIRQPEDVSVEVSTDGGELQMGHNASIRITTSNKSQSARSAVLHGQISVMYYTGVIKATVKKDIINIDLLPGEEKTVEWVVTYADYQDQLVDQAALVMTVAGRVSQSGQVLATQHVFRLRTPDLQIQPEGSAVVGQKMQAKIIFTNPLPKTLKSAVISVEGPGLQTPKRINIGDVARHSTITLTETFVPAKSGPRKLIANLDCRQLTQVHGVAEIIVQDE